jgi:hypothetical protein
VPDPALASLPPHGRAWEITRYRAYQAYLAGHTTGEVFGRVAAFLELTAAKAMPVTDNDLHTALTGVRLAEEVKRRGTPAAGWTSRRASDVVSHRGRR